MSTKRKATLPASAAAPDASESPISKRRKFEDIEAETPEITSQTGYDLLAQIRKSRDKQGNLISTPFETLPDEKIIPEYYDAIKLPIALDTLQGKLDRHEYATISQLEGDVKRMISNAKSFNETSSPIYSDAEKVRKLVSNFMVERNPAYRDRTYQAVATPIPAEQETRSRRATSQATRSIGDVKAESVSSDQRSGRRGSRPNAQAASEHESQRASSTPALQDEDDDTEGFEGLTFQKAQLKIIRSMMQLTDDEDRLISANFLNLPSRSLTDYYRLIKSPMCLRKLQKQALGQIGRDDPPKPTSLMRSWDQFEGTAGLIWRNAKEYNEEGSEIVEMAEQLEAHFNELLAEAKAAVEEPKKPLKLTLKEPQPAPMPHLKLTQPKPPRASGISVDNESLKRQQELVSAGMSGHRQSAELKRAASSGVTNGTEQSAVDSVKREASHAPSPKLAPSLPNGANGARASPMPPPSTIMAPNIASTIPRPQVSQLPAAAPAPSLPPAPPTYSHSNFNSQIRPVGKDALSALFSNLNISTRPISTASTTPPIFNLNIPASQTRTHQSKLITLPATSRQIRLGPTLSSSLLQRPSKTFVTCNNIRLSAAAQMELNQMKPVYDCSLLPGVNTIEVEVIAGMPRGAVKAAGGATEIEIEKMTIYAHLQAL